MKKVWLEQYPEGTPHTIDTNGKTLNDLFSEVCTKYPNNRAVTCNDETVTYKEIELYVNNLAGSLSGLGVKKGDRVAVIMPNLIQYPIAIFAIMQIGAIVVNINPLYTDHEIDYLLENSGAKTIIVLDMMAGEIKSFICKTPIKECYCDTYR